MTSPIYLLPIAVVYQCGGLFALPPTAHFALFSTFCTAVSFAAIINGSHQKKRSLGTSYLKE
jgi:hypothetical protein